MDSKPLESIDVSDLPDLLRLVDEVRFGAEPRLLRRGDQALAVLTPLPFRRQPPNGKRRGAVRPPSPEQREIMLSAAGSWSDIDADRLIERIHATRDEDDRPPIDL